MNLLSTVHSGAFRAAAAAVAVILGSRSLPIDNVSTTTKSSLSGAYGLVRLSSTYTGPTVKVRRGNDNTIADFYANATGSLGTALNGTGTSITSWANGATCYVTTWYDQSGSGRNATQTNTTIQPTLDITNRRLTFPSSAFFNLPDGTVPFNNSAYTVTLKHGTLGTTSSGFLGSGSYGTAGGTNAFRLSGTSYLNYWWGNDYFVGTYVAGNVVSFTYDGITRLAYINTTQQATGGGNGRVSTSVANTIGVTNGNEYLVGTLYFLFISNVNISNADRNMLESTVL